jgi:hypothetical protein
MGDAMHGQGTMVYGTGEYWSKYDDERIHEDRCNRILKRHLEKTGDRMTEEDWDRWGDEQLDEEEKKDKELAEKQSTLDLGWAVGGVVKARTPVIQHTCGY